MNIIEPSVALFSGPSYEAALLTIERAARTCYQSFDKEGEGTAEKLIRHCISKGHESVLEHVAIGLRLITDRGVTHELVRHRVGVAYSQESTRYVNYRDGVDFIEPWWWDYTDKSMARVIFANTCRNAEQAYKALLEDCDMSPQAARAILPNCLKTDIVVTANIRAWRHIINLRISPVAHPDMRGIMNAALGILSTNYPIFFEDIR